jgi:hypothetical protein
MPEHFSLHSLLKKTLHGNYRLQFSRGKCAAIYGGLRETVEHVGYTELR